MVASVESTQKPFLPYNPFHTIVTQGCPRGIFPSLVHTMIVSPGLPSVCPGKQAYRGIATPVKMDQYKTVEKRVLGL